jgi:hypothetical protein
MGAFSGRMNCATQENVLVKCVVKDKKSFAQGHNETRMALAERLDVGIIY